MNDLGNKVALAKNLKRLMEEKNVSAKEFSRTMDYPYTTLLSWLKAENYPRINRIEEMARYFGVMKSDLIEEKPTDGGELPTNKAELMRLVDEMPEEQAALAVRLLKTILETD